MNESNTEKKKTPFSLEHDTEAGKQVLASPTTETDVAEVPSTAPDMDGSTGKKREHDDEADEAQPLLLPSIWPPFAVVEEDRFVLCFAHALYMIPLAVLIVFGLVQVGKTYVKSQEPYLVSSFERTEFIFPTVTICPSAYRDLNNQFEFTQDDIDEWIYCSFENYKDDDDAVDDEDNAVVMKPCVTKLIDENFDNDCVELKEIGSQVPCVVFNPEPSQKTDVDGYYTMIVNVDTDNLNIRDYTVTLSKGDPRNLDPGTCRYTQYQLPSDGLMVPKVSNSKLETLDGKVQNYYELVPGALLPYHSGTPESRSYQLFSMEIEASEYAVQHLKQETLNIFLVLGSVAGLFAYLGLGFKLFFTDKNYVAPIYRLNPSIRSVAGKMKKAYEVPADKDSVPSSPVEANVEKDGSSTPPVTPLRQAKNDTEPFEIVA